MNPKTLKILAISYAVKTALVGVAWLIVPDLPQRARAKVVETWNRGFGSGTTPQAPVGATR